ncbi:MAG: AP2 domain-containing protein [Phycisphaerae bacterium]|nr:AP2 domain-containing protein [Phycisphaerae bacterium]
MYYDIRIYVPKLLDTIGIIILLWLRKKIYGYPFRKIYLTKGKYAIVSPEDFEEVNKHKWRAVGNHNYTYYAARMTYPCGRKKQVMMHREIMKLPSFDLAQGRGRLVIDHKDGDGLNNTRDNLSIVTAAENSYNRRKYKNECSSKYKGVSLRKRDNKWSAIITYKGIPIRLGYFDNEIDAAKAYDEAAKELHREYAKLNFG